MDGLEATRRIRTYEREANRPPAYICAVTAHASAEDRAECLAAEMCAGPTSSVVVASLGASPFSIPALRPVLDAIYGDLFSFFHHRPFWWAYYRPLLLGTCRDAFLPKPITPDSIRDVLATVQQHHRGTQLQ